MKKHKDNEFYRAMRELAEEQEDFDDILVCDPNDYSCEEEFLELVGSRFPDNKIPDHLDWPYKGEQNKNS